MNTVVGRLAPSPTGAQHIGNARTFLIAWLSARSQGGRVLLRLEDIDSPRVKKGAADLLLEDLRWLGLDWDDSPIVQSTRISRYEEALRQLQRFELVYPCTCSRKDIEDAASAPHLGTEPPPYPGTCAKNSIKDAKQLENRPYSWRFRYPPPSGFQDGFWGPISTQASHAGDFVVWKNTRTPAYQLAVVIDDADSHVTEVIRGDDLIPSTPRQLALYQALNLTPPVFSHVPLVVGTDGRRLAKRHGDTRLLTLRKQGVSAESLIGLLAWSCGWLDQPRPIRPAELVSRYSLQAIPRQPWVLESQVLQRIGFRTE